MNIVSDFTGGANMLSKSQARLFTVETIGLSFVFLGLTVDTCYGEYPNVPTATPSPNR
jgi:hypothetical protein